MKLLAIILVLFSGFFQKTNHSEEEKVLNEAEKLMLTDPEKSFDLARELLKDNSLEHKNELRSLFVCSNTSNILQKPLDVIKYGNLTLEHFEQGDDIIIKIKALILLGNTYQSLQLNEKARMYLDQAELMLSAAPVSDYVHLTRGNVFYLKAINYYFISMDPNMAIPYFDKSIREYMLSKTPVAKVNVKLAYLNKGYTLIEQKHLQQAKENFMLAGINALPGGLTYPSMFAERQKIYLELAEARMYSAENKPELSNEVLFKIQENKPELSNEVLFKIQENKNKLFVDEIENDIYKLLAENFLKKNDMVMYDHYQNLYVDRVGRYTQVVAGMVDKLIRQEEEQYALKEKENSREFFLMLSLLLLFTLPIILFLTGKAIVLGKKCRNLRKEVYGILNTDNHNVKA